MGQFRCQHVKTAEDSRTRKPRGWNGVGKNAPASWSAAVLCRFLYVRSEGRIRLRPGHALWSLLLIAFAPILQSGFAAERHEALPPEFQWPTPTRENRPWTRWWWLGSAVDKTNLTRLLTEYRDA